MTFDWKLALYTYLLLLIAKIYQMFFVNTEDEVSH